MFFKIIYEKFYICLVKSLSINTYTHTHTHTHTHTPWCPRWPKPMYVRSICAYTYTGFSVFRGFGNYARCELAHPYRGTETRAPMKGGGEGRAAKGAPMLAATKEPCKHQLSLISHSARQLIT